jgi:hypothetical protein
VNSLYFIVKLNMDGIFWTRITVINFNISCLEIKVKGKDIPVAGHGGP